MSKLSHLNERGEAHMVDVSGKDVTTRSATARGRVTALPATIAIITSGTAKKGDVLVTARLAGIMAAKKTSDLIPLCHPLMISKVAIEFSTAAIHIDVEATVKVEGKTGVEMEALTACSVACLTIYDMLKAVDRGMTITDIRLIEKTGGKSGTYRSE
jgi:cyclic pyranopterin monophosphate synthase